MAMTAVRNGSCSVKIDVAPEVGEAPVPVPVPVLEAAEDEAGSESKSTEQVGKKMARDTYCRILGS